MARKCRWRHAGKVCDVTRWESNGLGASAVGAEHLGSVGEKAAADEWRVAAVADEALTVPVTVVERYELGASQTCACTYQWTDTTMVYLLPWTQHSDVAQWLSG